MMYTILSRLWLGLFRAITVDSVSAIRGLRPSKRAPYLAVVSSKPFCLGSASFFPRLAVGEVPLLSFLRLRDGGDDFG